MKRPSLSHRQRLIAFYVACARPQKEIAKELGVTPQTISIAKRSPLFHVLVTQIQRDMINHGVKSTVDQVLADGAENVRFLRRLRDGDKQLLEECDEKFMKLRLGASTVLFDRQMPRVREREGVAPSVVINIDGMQRTLAENACREVGEAIDVTPRQLTDQRRSMGWHLQHMDDAVKEFEAADAADG